MHTLTEIFSLYKLERDLGTDDALAACLGLRKTALSNYKHGTRRLPDRAVIELADVTGIDAGEILTIANATYTGHDEEERAFWLARLAVVASVGVATASTAIQTIA